MNVYVLQGHNDIAEKWFLESIRLNPDQANIYSNLGSLYGMTNRPQQAEEMFKQAVTINPTYVEGYFNLGENRCTYVCACVYIYNIVPAYHDTSMYVCMYVCIHVLYKCKIILFYKMIIR